MNPLRIVLDTNVIISALRSRRGAAFRLLSIIDSKKFVPCISVPLILEYEEVAKRMIKEMGLSKGDVEALIDYFCKVAEKRKIHYLWRPLLKDPKDDMVLELAVEAGCDIITYNQEDFVPAVQFGVCIMTPQEFLKKIGELP